MLVCSKCRGKNIQKLAWVWANFNTYAREAKIKYDDDMWCEDCDSFTEFDIIDEEEEFYDEIFG